MFTGSRARPSQQQAPRHPFGSYLWVVSGTQVVEPSPATSYNAIQQEAGLEARYPGTQTSTLIYSVNVPSVNLAHFTITPAPSVEFTSKSEFFYKVDSRNLEI